MHQLMSLLKLKQQVSVDQIPPAKKLGPYKQGMTFGHEFSGIVEEVGSDVSGLNVGDAVTGCPAVVCHQCHYCEKVNTHVVKIYM